MRTRATLASRAAGAAVALAAVLACVAARAQDGPEHPPPGEQTPAVRETKRVLEASAAILETTERNDAREAAKSARDASWLVRRLAAIRLEVLGLDADSARELKDAAAPGKPPLAAEAAPVAKANELAAKLGAPTGAIPEPEKTIDNVRLIAALLTEEVQRGRCGVVERRELVSSLQLFFWACDDAEGRRFLARRVLALADRDAILKDLKAKDDDAASKDPHALLGWWHDNGAFCFFAKREGRFRLDAEARAAKKPSDDFRKDHPWRDGEGPDAAGPRPSGER